MVYSYVINNYGLGTILLMLLAAAAIVLQTGIDFHVLHIPGKDNTRADMLSRLMYEDYIRQYPADTIRFFSPPRELLPSRWKNSF